MTSDARRRVDALTVATAPCRGCLEEDIHDTERETLDVEIFELLLRLRRRHNEALRAQGVEATPEPTQEERQYGRERAEAVTARAKQTLGQLQARRRRLMAGPLARLRQSCGDCVNRKRVREERWRLVARL